MTPLIKGANSVASTSRRPCRVVHMVVLARLRSAAPYQNHDRTTLPDAVSQASELKHLLKY